MPNPDYEYIHIIQICYPDLMATISYSKLLAELIEPILDGEEDLSEYVDKASIGMLVWNYHSARTAQSPFFEDIEEIYHHFQLSIPNGPIIFHELLQRKERLFGAFTQFLAQVETHLNQNGKPALTVKSLSIDKLPDFLSGFTPGQDGEKIIGRLMLMPYSKNVEN